MKTDKLHELLIEYAEGTLSSERKADVDNMLVDSAELRREVELLRSVFHVLQTEDEGSVPDHYFTNFLPRLREILGRGEGYSPWSLFRLLKLLSQPVLALMVVFSLYGLYQSFSPDMNPSSIYSLVKEFEQNEITAIVEESSLFTSSASESNLENRLPGELFGIDPANYQTENEMFALLEEQDAEKVVERLQRTVTQ